MPENWKLPPEELANKYRDQKKALEERIAELEAEVAGLRESLERCLAALRKFDSVDYDEYGGPHLSEGITKLGKQIEELEAERDSLRMVVDASASLCREREQERDRLLDALVGMVKQQRDTFHGMAQSPEEKVAEDLLAEHRRIKDGRLVDG